MVVEDYYILQARPKMFSVYCCGVSLQKLATVEIYHGAKHGDLKGINIFLRRIMSTYHVKR